MGDFEEVERLQAGIRTWLLRTARSGRHELHGISAPAVLPMLCAAAFGPALADADDPAPGLARMGVLVSVGADVLARLLEGRPAGTAARWSPPAATAPRSWDVAFPAGLLAGACAIADQSLTRQQWASYAGTQPFQRVCPAS